MSSNSNFDEDASRRTYTAPYTSHNKVPNIQEYREHRDQRKVEAAAAFPDRVPSDDVQEGKSDGVIDSVKKQLHLKGSSEDNVSNAETPYSSHNRNIEQPAPTENKQDEKAENRASEEKQDGQKESAKGEQSHDTVESAANELDPRSKRKAMKHMERDRAGREVTDPVTHLPVMIHDSTNKELGRVPENEPPPGSGPRTSTGFSAYSKSESQLAAETDEVDAEHRGMEKLFPPPNFDAAREKLATLYRLAITIGLGSLCALSLVLLVGSHIYSHTRNHGLQSQWPALLISSSLLLVTGASVEAGLIWGLQDWIRIKVQNIWDEEIWDAAKIAEKEMAQSPTPESTQWLNSLLSSFWSLINPDLFTSLADTLEDVMQASLPRMVKMISVEDLGQGNESIRVLGVRWLPTGAAARDVSVDGRVMSGDQKDKSDRKVPGEGAVDKGAKSDDNSHNDDQSGDEKQQMGDETNIAEGMEAEQGDFVNMEVAFSYRASSTGKSLKLKAKNAHLYLAFYLPGKIRLPVWVELRGIVGTMRLRLQLCPDPPFFSLCTLTLLGQPKADISCVPLIKKGLNIMDLPLISSFVQSAVDAALAEYVAPKSLTLDVKDMLMGDDFKKDTSTRGVLVVRIVKGEGFKEGDPGIVGKRGSSDAYVTTGWGKFGKPVWSTRVIVDDMHPVWDETSFILVGQEELNADERLRIQLWDSDRASADDHLGKIEVDLKELMHDKRSRSRIWDRKDSFMGLESKDSMPGSLYWSVGFFPKTKIQDTQLQQQQVEPDIKTIQQLKEKVSKEVDRKLREATDRETTLETDQQKAQDLKVKEDSMIISTPPLEDYPSGILSVQIHQITGLEFEQLSKSKQDEGDSTEEGSDDLPSSYCTIILNHQKIFRTRTKPKNAKPFFNAGTERYIRDWRTTEVMISIRDSRVHENDPLLGIIYLPLSKIFHKRSQLVDQFPLVGGIGYGRARISIIFRSIQLQVPRELLGWEYGTLEVTGPITSKDLAADLCGLRLKLRTSVTRGKVYSTGDGQACQWKGKHDRPVRLAVRQRYSSCLVLEFRKNSFGPDKTAAFAVLWLKDIPDEEEKTVTLPVWQGHQMLKRAETCCTDNLGDPVGSLEVPLKFFHGLSSYHKRLASDSPSLQDVFEVLETANQNREVKAAMDGEDDGSGDSSDSSDSSDDDAGEEETDDGKRGPIDQVKDYKKHSDQLHRSQRGLMQWKGARTGAWMKTKLEHGKDHLKSSFQHHDREPGVETE
ncbi:MAG: hypothetical protein Q9191_003519, partial [Dirinaria sp. TL-2023a]